MGRSNFENVVAEATSASVVGIINLHCHSEVRGEGFL
jgi:hypothetical protein